VTETASHPDLKPAPPIKTKEISARVVTGADPAPSALIPGAKQLGEDKIGRSPVQFDAAPLLRKPAWIRVRLPVGNSVDRLKAKLRENSLVTVCEEASCPNIHECFSKGTATFMILGSVCTRRCSFCDVAHGRPKPPDENEPQNLAKTIADMALRYVVITSVDRDDLADGGAAHFVACIQAARLAAPALVIEVLVPDFRGKGRMDRALEVLKAAPPDVFNHNLETVRRRYLDVRPGADYDWSLNLLKKFKAQHPAIPTKSGIMLGLGETREEVLEAMQHLREHDVDIVTLGQYLQPTAAHHPVLKYWTPEEFAEFKTLGEAMGFANVASAPLVRSSYHADEVAHAIIHGGKTSLPWHKVNTALSGSDASGELSG
jgi:lipoyl synthase